MASPSDIYKVQKSHNRDNFNKIIKSCYFNIPNIHVTHHEIFVSYGQYFIIL